MDKQFKNRYNTLDNVVNKIKDQQKREQPEIRKIKKPQTLTPLEDQNFETQMDQDAYNWLAEQHKPKPTWVRNSFWAFIIGGSICTLGQLVINYLKHTGFTSKEASTLTVFILVFLGAFLTGLGVYDKIGKIAGAGSIVPITGFANSVVSSAMEFKREGYIYGLGSRLFTVAGPVLVYGFIISVIIGLLYYIFA